MVLPIGPWGGGAATFYQITNSLLFRGSQKLYRSFTSSSTWGLSVWVRRNALGAVNPILGSAVKFNASDTLTAGSLTTTAVYRDPTAWMHIAIAGGRLWVNGIDMGATTTSAFTCSATNCLGYDGTNYLNAEIAEFAFVDGTQPSSPPGRVDGVTGSWAPNPVSTSWGTNGAYLGKPWNPASLGTDYSGQSNNWTPNGFSASDVLSDSPTNVYATLNPLDRYVVSPQATFSGGNLRVSNGAEYSPGRVTLAVDAALNWWWEVNVDSAVASTYYPSPGILPFGVPVPSQIGETGGITTTGISYMANGQKYTNATLSAFGTSFAQNDVLGFHLHSGSLDIYKQTGGSGAFSLVGTLASGLSGLWSPSYNVYNSALLFNFGQRAFGNTSLPAGAKALCTANMPTTSGSTSGSFTGNANADGPCVYTGAVPQSLTINGNAVTWGTHADRLATGFKLRTSSASYNSTSTNNWTATYSTPQKPTVGSNKVPSNAQGNP